MNLYQDLETFLIKNGVSISHISTLKKEQPFNQEVLFKLSLIYEDERSEKTMNAPVNRIMATSRKGLPGDSWFDLAKNASMSLGADKSELRSRAGEGMAFTPYDDGVIRSNIDKGRIIESLSFLMNSGNLSGYHQSLVQDIQPVSLIYYDKDEAYIVGSDGNHRTIMAKLTEAPLIKASVSTYNFSQDKHDNYILIEESVNRLDQTLQRLNFTSSDEHIHYGDKAVIGAFINGDFEYYFNFKNHSYEISFLVSNEEKTQRFIDRMEYVIERLNQLNDIKNEYKRFYHTFKWLKIGNVNKHLLSVYWRIRCAGKERVELSICQLAYSMALQDLEIKNTSYVSNSFIAF